MSSSSKRLREEEQEIADNQLGEELNDLYAANQISAKKANSLLAKSSKAGLKFRHAFKNQVTSKNNGVHNAARTLLRWMKKQSAWGKLYWCKIPLWDKQKKASRFRWHPFLLPHGWPGTYLACKGSNDEGQPRIGTFQYRQLAKVAMEWGGSMLLIFFLWWWACKSYGEGSGTIPSIGARNFAAQPWRDQAMALPAKGPSLWPHLRSGQAGCKP